MSVKIIPAFPVDFKFVPKNCPQCGRFMQKKGVDQHPENEELHQRLECECGQVDHDFIGWKLSKTISKNLEIIGRVLSVYEDCYPVILRTLFDRKKGEYQISIVPRATANYEDRLEICADNPKQVLVRMAEALRAGLFSNKGVAK